MSWRKRSGNSAVLSCVVAGGGPGGLGPLLWAAQQGILAPWLERGVAIVERTGRLGGSLGTYGIHSDSLGRSFLECLQAEGLAEPLSRVHRHPATLELEGYRDSFPPLSLVDRYLAQIGLAIREIFASQPASAIHFNTAARAIHLRQDGTVGVVVQQRGRRRRTLIARSAVVALGGRQPWAEQSPLPGLTLAHCEMRRVMPSNFLLTRGGFDEADRILAAAEGRPVVVLGGSHSAYAVARAMLHLPAASTLAAGQIQIVQRRPPRVFYPSEEAASLDCYEYEAGDVCPRTRWVSRAGGLRGHGRELWRQTASKPGTAPEPRVAVRSLQEFERAQLAAMLKDAALVVPCLGYRSETLPVYDSCGRRLALRAEDNADAVDADCRLLLADGGKLDNVFGIGLGCGFRPTESMGCEPNFDGQLNSLWLYHHDIGAIIYGAVQTIVAEQKPIIAAGLQTPVARLASSFRQREATTEPR